MKLSDYAKNNNITYRTAYRHWKLGLVKGKQLVTGTIVLDEGVPTGKFYAIYARVSSYDQKEDLKRQLQRIRDFCSSRGIIIEKEYSSPVPKKIPYDVPIVAMEELQEITKETMGTLAKAKKMVENINETAMELDKLIDKIKDRVPKDIKIPNIEYEKIVVKDVKIIPETVRVIGKIIAREG